TKLSCEKVNDLRQSFRRHRAGVLVCSNKLAPQCGEWASSRPTISMTCRKVGRGDLLQSIPPTAMRKCSRKHVSHRVDGHGTGLGDELILRLEMPVKAPMGKPGRGH